MKSLSCFVVLLGGCGFVHGASGPECTAADCPGMGSGDGDGSGSGNGSNDGTTDDGCTLQNANGPHGSLADFEVASDGARWLLTYSDDAKRSTVWRDTGSGWNQISTGIDCRRGILRVDAQSHAHVVCNMHVAGQSAESIVHATITGQSVMFETVVGVTGTQQDAGLVVSAELTANGMPAIVWLPIANGYLLGTNYQLSRSASGFWSTRELMTWEDADRVRVFSRGGELFLGYRDESRMLNIAKASTTTAGALNPFIRVPGPLGSFPTDPDAVLGDNVLGGLEDYDLARDTAGTIHLVVYDSADDGADVLTYYRKTATASVAPGPTPVSDGSAGEGISLALRPDSTPIMTYYASAIGGARLSSFDGSGWTQHDLGTTGIGERSRVRFDAHGHLHIAYQDVATNGVVLVDEVCP